MKTRILYMVALCALFLTSCIEPEPQVQGVVTVHFIDVGQGDAILIETAEGSMLIDAGEKQYGTVVIEYLTGLGVEELDYVVATHPHSDHIGGLPDVLAYFPVKKMWMPDVSHTSAVFEKLLDVIERKQIELEAPETGEEFWMGGAQFQVVGPISETYEDLNNYSIVLQMRHGDFSFLFTGDAESLSELEMVSSGQDIEADVVKIGHHGSRTSSSAEFLEAVNPQVAVISCGKENEYGHPHPEVVEALEEQGVYIYRTDLSGTIVLKSFDGQLDIYEEKEVQS